MVGRLALSVACALLATGAAPDERAAPQDDGADYVVTLRLLTWRPWTPEMVDAGPLFIQHEWYPDDRGPSGFQRLAPREYLKGEGPDRDVEGQLWNEDPRFVYTVIASASCRTQAGRRVDLRVQSGTLKDLVGAPMSIEAYYALEVEKVGPDGYAVVRWHARGVTTNSYSMRAGGPPVELKVGWSYRLATHPSVAEEGSSPAEGRQATVSHLPGHFVLLTILPAPGPTALPPEPETTKEGS